MANALLCTAVAPALVTVVALAVGLPPADASIAGILGINAMYVALFGLSAWLFRRAAERCTGAVVASG